MRTKTLRRARTLRETGLRGDVRVAARAELLELLGVHRCGGRGRRRVRLRYGNGRCRADRVGTETSLKLGEAAAACALTEEVSKRLMGSIAC